MLVGFPNGMMTGTLIVDAVLWSLPLEPEHFNPCERWEDPFEGIHAGGGGRRVPLTLRRTKLLSQPREYNSTQIVWH